MESLGFKQIKINRKVGSGGDSAAGGDPENKKYGLGVATPHEMVQSYGEVRTWRDHQSGCFKGNDRADEERTSALCDWSVNVGCADGQVSMVPSIGSGAPWELSIPKKGKIAMAISCDDMPDVIWSVDNPAYLLMSQLSEVLVNGLGKSWPGPSGDPNRRSQIQRFGDIDAMDCEDLRSEICDPRRAGHVREIGTLTWSTATHFTLHQISSAFENFITDPKI